VGALVEYIAQLTTQVGGWGGDGWAATGAGAGLPPPLSSPPPPTLTPQPTPTPQDWPNVARDLQTLGFIPADAGDPATLGLVEPLGRILAQLSGGGGATKLNIDR
jgi:hypothetical protein